MFYIYFDDFFKIIIFFKYYNLISALNLWHCRWTPQPESGIFLRPKIFNFFLLKPVKPCYSSHSEHMIRNHGEQPVVPTDTMVPVGTWVVCESEHFVQVVAVKEWTLLSIRDFSADMVDGTGLQEHGCA